jgi:tRNA A-37 threonylcarbamoyl transferase component Bud32
MANPPSIPEIRHLHTTFGDDGADYEHLMDYGGLQYHLLLRYNYTELNCLENTFLKKIYDAFAVDDFDGTQEAAHECLVLVWPFMERDYSSRVQSNAGPSGSIKLQVITKDGVLSAVPHNLHMEYPRTNPVENLFPDVPTYLPEIVQTLDEIKSNIFKVKIQGSVYCLKTVHRTGNEQNFTREVSILRLCSHPNIIRLCGIVPAVGDTGKIEGMLLDYIENAKSIRNIGSITCVECEKWTGQIRGAIEYLHRKGLVWGDAKAANVLIREDHDVVIIDFGGGMTKGWVDQENYESVRGDWQGFERIVEFMKANVV